MARITVEDCLKNVKNRFELVIIAASRARQLMKGREPMVPLDNDKSTVVALREIAEGYTDFNPQVKETHEDITDKFSMLTREAEKASESFANSNSRLINPNAASEETEDTDSESATEEKPESTDSDSDKADH